MLCLFYRARVCPLTARVIRTLLLIPIIKFRRVFFVLKIVRDGFRSFFDGRRGGAARWCHCCRVRGTVVVVVVVAIDRRVISGFCCFYLFTPSGNRRVGVRRRSAVAAISELRSSSRNQNEPKRNGIACVRGERGFVSCFFNGNVNLCFCRERSCARDDEDRVNCVPGQDPLSPIVTAAAAQT